MAGQSPRALVAGNWKMNGRHASFKEVRLLAGMLADVELKCDVMICPPATLLWSILELVEDAPIALGGQDCHAEEAGAHTGDLSAEMLADAGARAVIVGHSERRSDHGETNETVRAKAAAAHRADLTAIICIGESLAEREAGGTLDIVAEQLAASFPPSALPDNTVIAYEPVWAIGSGLTPTPDQVAEVHRHIRSTLARLMGSAPSRDVRILYGGSVKPSNADELMKVDNVDGALVGGASLQAADFIGIIKTFA